MTSGSGWAPLVNVPRTATSFGDRAQPAANPQATARARTAARRRERLMGGPRRSVSIEREGQAVLEIAQSGNDADRVRAIPEDAHRAVAEQDVQAAGVRRPPV